MSAGAMRFTVGKDIFPNPHSLGCDACNQPLQRGQRVYMLTHLATPWKAEDAEDHEWSSYCWHQDCDEGSLAAETGW